MLLLAASLILTILASLASPPLSQGFEVVILSHSSHIRDPVRTIVIAEVQNKGSEILTLVNVTATFYDDHGFNLGSTWAYTTIEDLFPYQRSPVRLIFEGSQAQDVHSYTLAVAGATKTDTYCYRNLEVVHSSWIYNEFWCLERYCVFGDVRNIGNCTANSIKVIISYYDHDNVILWEASGYTNPKDLDPGEKASFQIGVMELADIMRGHSIFVEAETTSPPPTPSPTVSPTPSPSPSPTPVTTPTPTPSATPTPTSTPTPSPSPTAVPTPSPKPTAITDSILTLVIVLSIATVAAIGFSLYKRRKTKPRSSSQI